MTYTPGPWFYDGECFICSDGPDIASVVKAATGWEANARLIAAAPDMLTALKLAQFAFGFGSSATLQQQQHSTYLLQDAAEAITAAIAKATGGES
jgi:hypothetical protein